MTTITRIFASLLFLLCVVAGLGLAGSWHLRHDLLSQTFLASAHPGNVITEDPAGQSAWLDEVEELRTWTTAAQALSLLLCVALCTLGLNLLHRASREARRREEAERELERERRALEKRVADRTRELSQQVEERRRAEEVNRGHKQVLEMLASPHEQSTENILHRLTATVASQRRPWECSLHLVDHTTKTLQLAASSEVDEKLRRYLLSIGADFFDAPESQAWASGQMHIVETMTQVRRPWSELLVANGILSAWSVPFRTGAHSPVAGTLTVYSRLHTRPTPRDLEILESTAGLAALVIEHRRIHAELVHSAYHDELTDIPNRRAGELALKTAIAEASRKGQTLAVFWIDIDRFKRINDQYGHGAGDRVLRTVAGRLRDHSQINGKLARMGGDEFLLLVPGDGSTLDVDAVSSQLCSAIAEPIDLGSSTITVTGSVGICLYPRDGTSIEALERNADFAMYRAKAARTGACIYSPSMSAEAREALEIEEGLSVALEQQSLRLLYQPVFSRKEGLVCFEALLRFRHSRLGEISPARFIPIAEETKLIIPIGDWVLRQACRQLKTWHNAGFSHVRIAVNISAIQFAHERFAETVATVLRECALPSHSLILELTETAVMGDYEAIIHQLNLLRGAGVRIAMDDFGTGYSSLSYLHKLPIDILKIDRSFTERITEQEGTRHIVEAIISIANRRGLYIVAEGVETVEQQTILQEAGCHGLQGYLFFPPLTPEKAGACLTAGTSAHLGWNLQSPDLNGISVA